MSVIAGLKDFRKQGAPADIGTFQFPATAMVFHFTFSGTTYTCAIASGAGGWELIAYNQAGADEVVINAAIAYLTAFVYPDGGGHIYISTSTQRYILEAPIIVDRPLLLEGAGRWGRTVLELADGADCRMIDLQAGAEWCHLKNLHLEGNKANQTGGDYLIEISVGDYLEMSSVYVMRGYDGGIHAAIQDCHFYDVYVEMCDGIGWDLGVAQNGQFINCTSWDNGSHGVRLGGGRGTFNNFRIMMNAGEGIFCNTVHRFFFHGCYINENGDHGLHFFNSDYLSVTDCIIRDNGQDGNFDGIFGNGTNNKITIKGCKIYSTGDPVNNQRDGIRLDGTTDDIQIALNHILDNDGYGINILSATNVDTLAKNNDLSGNGLGPINDLGLDTKLATIIIPFIQGTTFISADGSAKGWEINAEADMAVALGQLLAGVQQVVRIKIWAVALGAPAGGGGQMHLDILFNAGGSLEDYNLAANSWTLANFDSEEADYANNKVVHWVVEDGDVGNEISNLLGGDSLELKVNGGTAVAEDGATNATFRVMEIPYV